MAFGREGFGLGSWLLNESFHSKRKGLFWQILPLPLLKIKEGSHGIWS